MLMNNNYVLEKKINPIILSNAENGIILYGAGINAYLFIKQYMAENPQHKILCIVDIDSSKQGKQLLGIPIISPDKLSQYDTNTCIIVTPFKYYIAITDTLNKLGFYSLFYYCDYSLAIINEAEQHKIFLDNNKTVMDQLLKENEMKISALRQYFKHDKKSLAIFEAKLSSSFTGDHIKLETLQEDDQYFPDDIIKLTQNEVFVDCGAYDGLSTLEFINKVDTYKNIYVLEPNPSAFEHTKLVLQASKGLTNYEIYNIGAYNSQGQLSFSVMGDCSTIASDGDITIPTDTLDSLFFNKTDRPTYIKMDIEGAELNALEGTRKLIERDKPKLAISVYHGRPNIDIWEIPYWLISNFPGYRIFLRQHQSVTETVLYAI